MQRKDTRASTANKTAETAKRQKERVAIERKRKLRLKKTKKEYRELTQAEILDEAKWTEQLNLESLKRFEQMEVEAKKRAFNNAKRAIQGPFIRYHSTAAPLIQVISSEAGDSHTAEEPISVDEVGSSAENEADDDDDAAAERDGDDGGDGGRGQRQERTFVTFSDHDTFRKNFPLHRPKQPQQKICPITRLPAKYFDPVTRLPYATIQAFRILREAYYNQLEVKGNRDDPEQHSSGSSPSTPATTVQLRPPPQPIARAAGGVGAAAAMPQQCASCGKTFLSTTGLKCHDEAVHQGIRHQCNSCNKSYTQQQQQQHHTVVQSGGAAVNNAIQTVKIGGQTAQVSLAGSGMQLPRTMATTTLTAQQLQQLAASRGQVLSSALQSALRGGGLGARAQLIARPAAAAAAGQAQMTTTVAAAAAAGQTMLRPQTLAQTTGLVQSSVRTAPQQPTIALQRPATTSAAHLVSAAQVTQSLAGAPIAVAVSAAQPGVVGARAQTIALQPSAASAVQRAMATTIGGSVAPQQIVMSAAAGAGAAGRQQIVVASGGQHGGRQIVMTQGGQPVRSGQILQVTGQGGQQHQIVVSQGGQLILSSPSTANTNRS